MGKSGGFGNNLKATENNLKEKDLEKPIEDPIYNIEDDEDDDPWGINYAQASNYIIEDEEGEENPDDSANDSISSPFLSMLRVLLAPVEGWKVIRRKKLSVERAQAECFYPLLAILAVSNFISYVYVPRITLSQIIVAGVVDFVSFFFGYFCIMIFLKTILPSVNRKVIDSEFGKVFVVISLSSLALFWLITNLLPMIWAILIFLPLWTIYIICRGIRFFNIPERGTLRFTVFVTSSIIGFPYGIYFLLGYLMPQ